MKPFVFDKCMVILSLEGNDIRSLYNEIMALTRSKRFIKAGLAQIRILVNEYGRGRFLTGGEQGKLLRFLLLPRSALKLKDEYCTSESLFCKFVCGQKWFHCKPRNGYCGIGSVIQLVIGNRLLRID